MKHVNLTIYVISDHPGLH